jgi:hypothetical protein
VKAVFCFALWSVGYGALAYVVIFLVAITTCGFSPDSVEMCDITALVISEVALFLGYLGMAFYFYRTRIADK